MTESQSNTPTVWEAGEEGGWGRPEKVTIDDNNAARSSTNNASELYKTFGFSIPEGYDINSVKILIKCQVTDPDEAIGVAISWDDGATYTAFTILNPYTDPPSYSTYILDATQKTNWDADKVSKVSVKIKYSVAGGGGGGGHGPSVGELMMWTGYVDFLQVTVEYNVDQKGVMVPKPPLRTHFFFLFREWLLAKLK